MKPGARHDALFYVLIALMVLLWAANFIVGKIALRQFPPMLLGGLRVSFAALFMLPVYLWQARREGMAGHAEDAPLLIGMGIVGVGLNQMLFVLGLARTTAAHSSIFIGLTPLFVLLLAAFKKQERITARRAAGMAVALAGVALLNGVRYPEGRGGPTLLGDGLVTLAAVTFAIFTVAGKGVTHRHSSITVTTFAYGAGALSILPVIAWQAGAFDFHTITTQGWITVVYMALFPSVICYLIYYWALTRIPASRLSAFTYLQPILTTAMGAVWLGEHVTAQVVAGGSVILGGVYLVERE